VEGMKEENGLSRLPFASSTLITVSSGLPENLQVMLQSRPSDRRDGNTKTGSRKKPQVHNHLTMGEK
jgi:hypothetical protein